MNMLYAILLFIELYQKVNLTVTYFSILHA